MQPCPTDYEPHDKDNNNLWSGCHSTLGSTQKQIFTGLFSVTGEYSWPRPTCTGPRPPPVGLLLKLSAPLNTAKVEVADRSRAYLLSHHSDEPGTKPHIGVFVFREGTKVKKTPNVTHTHTHTPPWIHRRAVSGQHAWRFLDESLLQNALVLSGVVLRRLLCNHIHFFAVTSFQRQRPGKLQQTLNCKHINWNPGSRESKVRKLLDKIKTAFTVVQLLLLLWME